MKPIAFARALPVCALLNLCVVPLAGCAVDLERYDGPLSIAASGPSPTLAPDALAARARDLAECKAQVANIRQAIDWPGMARMALTGGVQGFLMGMPAYGATKTLVPAELTGGGQALANGAEGATNDWSFLANQKRGWVDQCMAARALASHAYTVLR